MKKSVRNYVTKTLSKNWGRDPRNTKKSMKDLSPIVDNPSHYRVREEDDYIEAFCLVDEDDKLLFAVGGRDPSLIQRIIKSYVALGYNLALYGGIPLEYEKLFTSVADLYIEDREDAS